MKEKRKEKQRKQRACQQEESYQTTYDDETNVNGNRYRNEQAEYEYFNNRQEAQDFHNNVNVPAATSPTKAVSLLKGIKRDVNAYKDFKEERYYDSWIRSVKATARLHGVSKVLDKDYIPMDEEAIDAFEDMQIRVPKLKNS